MFPTWSQSKPTPCGSHYHFQQPRNSGTEFEIWIGTLLSVRHNPSSVFPKGNTVSNKKCLSNCKAIYLKYPRKLVGTDWLPLHDDTSAALCWFEVLSIVGCAARGWGWRSSET